MNGNSEAKALTAANWIQFVIVILLILGMVAAVAESRLKPLEDKIDNLEKLQEKYDALLASVAADHSERVAKEGEIETQFNADSQLRNVQFSDQQRIDAVMWNHINGLGSYPAGPYFQPNISQQAQQLK
jgi:hypothetical protein